MFKIDKSTWEDMNANKKKVVTKQWLPKSSDADFNTIFTPADNAAAPEDIPSPLEDVPSVTDQDAEKQRQALRMQQEQILLDAKSDAEVIKKTAYNAGYNEGYRQGLVEAKEQLEIATHKQRLKVDEIIRDMRSYKLQLEESVRHNTLQLAVDIAEKILQMELDRNDAAFVQVVRKAVERMDVEDDIQVRLNHAQYHKYFSDGGQALLDDLEHTSVAVTSDQAVEDGGCVVESEHGFINAGIESQFERVVDSVMHPKKTI